MGNFYSWFWFYTEFWLTPVNRRPYTFIWRDWIFTHVGLFAFAIAIWFITWLILTRYMAITSGLVILFSAMVLAHLIWGTKWIEGQQEFPEYKGSK